MGILETHSFLGWLALFLCFNFLTNNGVEAFHRIIPEYQSVRATVVDQKYRTGYHFQPDMHWINDPNGPMYYNGFYHLFYQYNPYGSTWGNIVWAHSYSTDLINWIPLEPAIYPSEPFDINGTWSGSVTILPGNKPVIMYTGIDGMNSQVQNVAYPKNASDPLLREWVKPSYNPIISPNMYMNRSAFRDPSTAWMTKDGKWNVAIGHKRNARGKVEIYSSKDFKTWTRGKHPLHSVPYSGMWECPDFFPVLLNGGKEGLETSVNGNHVKHVFKVSLDITRFDYYTVGTYFEEKNRYIPNGATPDNSTGLRLDYGNFYASKSFFDEKKKRRILWGWANESDSKAADVRKGWAGIQAIPRNVWLDTNGKQVLQWPVEELETLRGDVVHLNNLQLSDGAITEVKGVTAAQADVEVTFKFPSLDNAEPYDPAWVDAEKLCSRKDTKTPGGLGPFGLLTLASKTIDEYTAIYFHIFKTGDKPVVLMCSGGPSSSLDTNLYKPSFGGFVDVDIKDGSISLRSLIDHSVVESFGAGGKVCITSRVYPTLAIGSEAHLYVFNNATVPITVKTLAAWSMNNARMK